MRLMSYERMVLHFRSPDSAGVGAEARGMDELARAVGKCRHESRRVFCSTRRLIVEVEGLLDDLGVNHGPRAGRLNERVRF
jgi:hypothetical protein